jgi:ribosomal protein L40E
MLISGIRWGRWFDHFMATHLCGKCGAVVGDSATTCPKCGTADHHPKPPEPQEHCAICDQVVRVSQLAYYSVVSGPSRSVNNAYAHEACRDRVIALKAFRCCDCEKPLPDENRPLYSQVNLSEPAYLQCPFCHGCNPLPTQAYCAQCKLPIFPWHRMVVVENPVPERYMPSRFPCHDFCKPALDNVMRLRAINHPKRGFLGWLRP